MNKNGNEIKSEQPTPDSPDKTITPHQPQTEAPEEISTTDQPDTDTIAHDKEEKAPPSRLKQFFQKALIWVMIIGAAFLAGFLVDHFVRYKPLKETLSDTQSALDFATQEISDLQSDNKRLTRDLNTANDEITILQDELALTTANVQYYQVLVDVNNARIQLFLEDTEAAQAALVETKLRLDGLLPYIAEVDSELALSLPRRLDLIVSGMERDPETAKIDLELFTKDLLEIKPELFEN
jgi:hypothetical protein